VNKVVVYMVIINMNGESIDNDILELQPLDAFRSGLEVACSASVFGSLSVC